MITGVEVLVVQIVISSIFFNLCTWISSHHCKTSQCLFFKSHTQTSLSDLFITFPSGWHFVTVI